MDHEPFTHEVIQINLTLQKESIVYPSASIDKGIGVQCQQTTTHHRCQPSLAADLLPLLENIGKRSIYGFRFPNNRDLLEAFGR